MTLKEWLLRHKIHHQHIHVIEFVCHRHMNDCIRPIHSNYSIHLLLMGQYKQLYCNFEFVSADPCSEPQDILAYAFVFRLHKILNIVSRLTMV